jgi:hypothetical protein
MRIVELTFYGCAAYHKTLEEVCLHPLRRTSFLFADN